MIATVTLNANNSAFNIYFSHNRPQQPLLWLHRTRHVPRITLAPTSCSPYLTRHVAVTILTSTSW